MGQKDNSGAAAIVVQQELKPNFSGETDWIPKIGDPVTFKSPGGIKIQGQITKVNPGNNEVMVIGQNNWQFGWTSPGNLARI